MTSVSKGVLFSVIVRVAWAEVLELRHVKPLASVPRGFLSDVMEDYNCWGGDLAELVIHADQAFDGRRRDVVVATCRAACLSNIGCQAWSLNHGSQGGRGSGHCWLKHSCENGDADPYSVSGLVDHKNLVRHVQAPDTVEPTELIGVLDDTNCWGRDLAEVAIESNGNASRDELIIACKDACVADRECTAWTLNQGRTGIKGQGLCWLKSSCSGRMHDTRAVAGAVTHNPSHTVPRQENVNNGSAAGTEAGGTTTGIAGGGATNNAQGSDTAKVGGTGNDLSGTDSSASDTARVGVSSSAKGGTSSVAADSPQGGDDSPRTIAGSTKSIADRSGRGSDSSTTSTSRGASSNAGGGRNKGNPGNSTSSESGERDDKLSEMRFLEHGDPGASAPQPLALRGGDSSPTGISEKDKGIIGGVVGASTGALAVGLLAGLLHPTSPQPSRGLDQLSPTSIVGGNTKDRVVGDRAGIFAVAPVNDTTDTSLEEGDESPVKRWWGWIFLIPLFLMAALCCFAIFMFKGNATGSWSKRIKRSRLYSRVGSEISTDTAEGMMSSDAFSPRSPVNVFPRNKPVYNAPTLSPRTFLRSPIHPQSRDISVPLAHSPNAHLRQLLPMPMAQAGVVVMTTSPQRLVSKQLQQQQQQHHCGQPIVVTSQQLTPVKGQQNNSNDNSNDNNSLFDALDQNQDGVITRSEFNRAFGVSPLLLNSAASSPVSAVISTSPNAMESGNSVMVATPGKQQATAEATSPLLHASPSMNILSQSTSSLQAVMGSPVLRPGSSGYPLEAASPVTSPQVEDRS